jgi:hypothetical protein
MSTAAPVNTTAPEQSAPAARYTATWGEGYSPNPGETTSQEVGLDFFHPDNGYSVQDVGRVASLQVGEDADLTDPSGQHWIRRTA